MALGTFLLAGPPYSTQAGRPAPSIYIDYFRRDEPREQERRKASTVQ